MKVTRRGFLNGAVGTGLVACAPDTAPPNTSEKRAPNILYILTDQHRWDCLGAMGNPAAITPALDALAARGTLFSHCFTNAPICRPARAAMATGHYPRQIGVLRNDDSPDPLGPSYVRQLRDTGYYTMLIGKAHLYQGEGNVADYLPVLQTWGYSNATEIPGPRELLHWENPYSDFLSTTTPTGEVDKLVRFQNYIADYGCQAGPPDDPPYELQTEDHLDVFIGNLAVQWIEDWDQERPFYLQVHFAGPHDPFDSTSEYRALFDDTTPFPPVILESPANPTPLASALLARTDCTFDEDVARTTQISYYAKMAMVDEMIGKVVAALDAKGLLDNTWIVFASDHGEQLGDHMMTGKTVMYEGSVHIPCIVVPPGGQATKVVDRMVDLLDLIATIQALAGVTQPVGVGASLVDVIDAAPGDLIDPGKDYVVASNKGYTMVRTRGLKLVVKDAGLVPVALFDLGFDPEERLNRVDDPTLAEEQQQLVDLLIAHEAQFPPIV